MNIGAFEVEYVVRQELPVRREHTAIILPVSEREKHSGDGVLIKTGETASLKTADCISLVIAGAAAALLLHVSRKNIAEMLSAATTFLPDIKPTHAAIGPHICARHFTFSYLGEELKQLQKKLPDIVSREDGIIHVDLEKEIHRFIDTFGIPLSNVRIDPRCTYEDESLPSYRRMYDRGESLTQHLFTVVTG